MIANYLQGDLCCEGHQCNSCSEPGDIGEVIRDIRARHLPTTSFDDTYACYFRDSNTVTFIRENEGSIIRIPPGNTMALF